MEIDKIIDNGKNVYYINLTCAILKQAVDDILSTKKTSQQEMHRQNAISFLCSDRLNFYCELIQVDVDAFRLKLIKNKIISKGDFIKMKDKSKLKTSIRTNLNEAAIAIHENAKAHGWWDDERSFGEIIALCHSELSEALEEFRDGKPNLYYVIKTKQADGQIIPEIRTDYGDGCYSTDKPEGIAVELADCIIRILDYCGKEKIDIDHAIKIKHEYNKFRSFKHGGKKI